MDLYCSPLLNLDALHSKGELTMGWLQNSFTEMHKAGPEHLWTTDEVDIATELNKPFDSAFSWETQGHMPEMKRHFPGAKNEKLMKLKATSRTCQKQIQRNEGS